jgi:hypothetical protein
VTSILRHRAALFALFGVMLIPVATSTLRGLTHVLTCEEEVATPFALIIEEQKEPTVISATTIERGEVPQTPSQAAPPARSGRLCGGLSVDLSARTLGPGSGKVAMTVPITNHTAFPWQGTVLFQVGRASIPVDVGEVLPGKTGSDEIQLDLGPGDHELTGSLLIGP